MNWWRAKPQGAGSWFYFQVPEHLGTLQAARNVIKARIIELEEVSKLPRLRSIGFAANGIEVFLEAL